MNSTQQMKRLQGVMKRFSFVLAAVACFAGTAQGATQYAAGSFTWNDASTAAWGSASGGPYGSVWTGGNDAVLEGASGTITISSPTAHNINFTTTGYVLSGASTLTMTGTTPTLTLGSGISATISSVVGGSAGLTKAGTGTLTLSGANTYTGTTTIKAGALTIGNGTTGSLNGSPVTDLTFTGTGTFNVQEVASSIQGMGTLTFSAGQGTITSTAATSGSAATLTFGSMSARTTGATAIINLAVNTTSTGGTPNKIVLTSTVNAPLSTGSNNPGIYFNTSVTDGTGLGYARYDAAGYFKAVAYGNDANTITTPAGVGIGVTTAITDVSVTGNVTGVGNVAANTIRFTAATLTQTAATTLSVNGIFYSVAGTTAKAIGSSGSSGGFMQPTSDGGELVLTCFSPGTGALQIAAKIQDVGLATKVTIAGTGYVTLQNIGCTYTGVTTINGKLKLILLANINTVSGIGKGSVAGSAADLVINGGTLNFDRTAAMSTDRLFTIGTAGATLDSSGTAQGTIHIGSGGGSIAFSSSSTPASLTLSGTGTGGTGATTGTGTLTAVLGDSGTGANVTSLTKSGVGTWILAGENTHSGLTIITGGTLQLGKNLALQNSVFDPSGAGALAFSSGINTPTFGGLTGATNLTLPANVTALTLNPGTGVTATYSGILGSVTSGMPLTKTGAGTQVLSGANTYSGETTVSNGTLALANSTALGATPALRIASGAKVDLATGISATAGTLYLNGKMQAKGTWGAVGTPGVAHTSTYFTGAGVLNVQTGLSTGTFIIGF